MREIKAPQDTDVFRAYEHAGGICGHDRRTRPGWEGAYVGGEPVGRRGLVDVVLVVVGVGAALRGLPFPPAHGAALHHAAAQLGRRLLRGVVGVAVLRHHAESREEGGVFSAAPSRGHLNVPSTPVLTLCAAGTTRLRPGVRPRSPPGCVCHRKSGFGGTAEESCDPSTGWRSCLTPPLWKIIGAGVLTYSEKRLKILCDSYFQEI